MLVVALALSGCGSYAARTPAALGSVGGLLYSNSPTRIADADPRREGEGMVVDYDLLFENHGAQPGEVMLDAALAALSDFDGGVEAHCLARGQSEAGRLVLAPGLGVSVRCELALSPEATRFAALGDRSLRLRLPLRVGRVTGKLTFEYRLEAEDAS